MPASPLLAWIDAPSPGRGIRFAGPGPDEWTPYGYERLAALARGVASGLSGAGIRPGEVVVLVGRSGPELVGALFGAMLAGATPAPVAPPLVFQAVEEYAAHLRGVLASARPALVVADADLAAEVRALVGESVPVATVETLLAASGGGPLPTGAPRGAALLQFTSGSSAAPRGVRVPYRALETNVAAIHRWLGWKAEDAFVSWLPLYHDMGLVGALVSAVALGSDLWLLRPEHFVRDPLRYLRCMGETRAALTVMPAFGLDLIARRLPAGEAPALDLSALRGIVIGAERIDPRVLEGFAARLAPCGLRRDALLPAYGLAEATLAVTGLPLGEGWSGAAVDPASLAPGREVRPAGPGAAETVVVGCGRPLAGVSVSVVGDGGEPLPEGWVGEIEVRGESVAAGEAGGRLRTGDAGFLLDGQLFVLGRLGDALKIRGRTLFAEEVEVALAGVGAPPRHLAVLLGVHAGEPTVVLVSEKPMEPWRPAAEAVLSLRTEGARLVLVEAPPGSIARTSSGKPRRRLLWRAWTEGNLPVAGAGPPIAGGGRAGAR